MLEKSTYYILDAQGNQLSIYEHSVDSATNTAYYYLTDRNIYGSSRLGVTKDTINMFNPYTLQSYGVVGNRNYELTDHRGNVQTVINDIKYPLSSDNTTVDSYEVGVSSVYDYSPFGVQLDGRTIDNVFYHPESTVDTVSVTAYALEETFDIASNWQEITTETQITYPSGKMRVRNPMSNRKKIGVKNEFITGEGLHSLSFEITYLPYTLCPIIVFPGEPIFPSQTNDSILDSEEFHIQSVKNSYLVFEIFDENSISILIDSTRSVGTYSYNFTALEGENYSVLFYINSLCNTRYFEIDNVFITYEEEAIVENTNAFIATNYRYSVQNQEHHDEIRGKGNYINYKYRGYDPRIGRLDWLVDPLAKDYPWNSPYAFSENRVLDGVELEGLEFLPAGKSTVLYTWSPGSYSGGNTNKTIMYKNVNHDITKKAFYNLMNDFFGERQANQGTIDRTQRLMIFQTIESFQNKNNIQGRYGAFDKVRKYGELGRHSKVGHRIGHGLAALLTIAIDGYESYRDNQLASDIILIREHSVIADLSREIVEKAFNEEIIPEEWKYNENHDSKYERGRVEGIKKDLQNFLIDGTIPEYREESYRDMIELIGTKLYNSYENNNEEDD